MYYISTKLFLILCEYVLVCTCTQGLIKKLIFFVYVPSITQLSTVIHCIFNHLAQCVFFVFGHNFFFLKKTKKIFVFCISHLGFIIKNWPYYLYIISLCTLFSLDELLLWHFTSLSFVVHVVWEMFIVFDHFVLILKSHVFDCRT